MRYSVKFAAIAIAVAALAGCNTMPIQNVSEAPVVTASGKSLSNEQVRSAIVRAGAALGWQMKEEGSGMLVGTLHLRKHTAVVAIPYSAHSYSVQYRSSVNMDENGGNIHKNYNGWIQNLTRGINAQLSLVMNVTLGDRTAIEARELAVLLVEGLNLEDVDASQIDLKAPLFGGALALDSLDLLEISLIIQQRYGVKLMADNPDNDAMFGSLESLAAYMATVRTQA